MVPALDFTVLIPVVQLGRHTGQHVVQLPPQRAGCVKHPVLEVGVVARLDSLQFLRRDIQTEVASLGHRAEHQTEAELVPDSLHVRVVSGVEQTAHVGLCLKNERRIIAKKVGHKALELGAAQVGFCLVVEEQ